MRIVVDASVVVSALMADGTVRDVLLSSTDQDFVAPLYIREEATKNTPRISIRASVSAGTVRALLEDVFGVVELLPKSIYDASREPAAAAARRADAHGDEEYVALAMFLDAPVWTLDDDFRRIRGMAVLTTRQVAAL